MMVFVGSVADIERMWIDSGSRWYPETLIIVGADGSRSCSVTGLPCDDVGIPIHSRPSSIQYVTCSSGETVMVMESHHQRNQLRQWPATSES